eukprot:TRINITY_DN150_c0_g4_i1.p1 TRINITY_DN150_c0_g4~~TRINITY_DN150_c0_g4_i1.p1  ORF type:complete len:945 (+),score=179.05 TRINITY_DN150_c0_g4_i1:339-2837(+)
MADGPTQLNGWFPIQDSLRGVCGELHATVKIQYVGDINPFREASAGIMLFTSCLPPPGWKVAHIESFVEELVAESDPEYHWSDTFRTMRSSNESRRLTLHKVAGRCQRLLGHKALDLDANAVLGVHVAVDLDSECIVGRASGTAVRIVKDSLPIIHSPASSPVVSPFGTPRALGSLSNPFSLSTSAPGDEEILPRKAASMGALADVSLLTMRALPVNITLRMGGAVCVRAVRVIEPRSASSVRETRDAWWSEVRNEIRAHARALGCDAVVGYSETATFCHDLCVLSATGTAASLIHKDITRVCQWAHAKRRGRASTFNAPTSMCGSCSRRRVPDIVLATVDAPLVLAGREQSMVEARVCRPRRRASADAGATAVSDVLPFVEYEVHRQLVRKLRLRGCNALFGLKTSVAVSDGYIIGFAQGTAYRTGELPLPAAIDVRSQVESEELSELLRRVVDMNVIALGVAKKQFPPRESEDRQFTPREGEASPPSTPPQHTANEDTDSSSDDEVGVDDIRMPGFVVDIDDEADEDVLAALWEPPLPRDATLSNSLTNIAELPPGNVRLISAVIRHPWAVPTKRINQQLGMMFTQLYNRICFKYRKQVTPALLSGVCTEVSVTDTDEVQLLLTASVMEPPILPLSPLRRVDDHELLFAMDEHTQGPATAQSAYSAPPPPTTNLSSSLGSAKLSPVSVLSQPVFSATQPMPAVTARGDASPSESDKDESASRVARVRVILTPLSALPGHRVLAARGRVVLHLIRENTTVRESGGVNMFAARALQEAQAMARAHTAALGGNALFTFQVHNFLLRDSPQRNTAYVVVSVSGDAVVCEAPETY